MQLCQIGFNCPYSHFIDGDQVCTYPHIRINQREIDDMVTFGFPDEQDCSLLEFGSELDRLLHVYNLSDKALEVIQEEYNRLDEESRKILKGQGKV